MNNRFFISSFLSLSIHALLFILPIKAYLIKNIDVDIIKAPASIEISMVRMRPQVIVETEKIKEITAKEKIKLKETPKKERSVDTEAPMLGALTEQISSLMINEPPQYPTLARIKGWEGEVVLVVNVNEKGRVAQTSVLSSSGFYILDAAATKAINNWRFRNIAEPTQITIPVKFVLTKN